MEADAELVRRALARDQQAFAALYDRYADKLYDYARRQTGNAADAGDIVQDTFVLAIQRLGQLRDPSLVRPWLYAIARSEVHRRHRRVNRLQFTEPDEQAAMTATGPTADDLVHQQELRTLFAEAANGLDPSDREVLDLHLRHSMTSAEIAAALGIPERQVSVVVQRVRERLGRSIGVVLLAKNPSCPELITLQRTEGTPLTVLSRKRLARHIEGCTTCSQQLSQRMRPETLLAALPIALAPAFLRQATMAKVAAAVNAMGTAGPQGPGGQASGNAATGRALQRRERTRVWQATDGFPRTVTSSRLIVIAAVGAALLLLFAGVLVVSGGDSQKRITAGTTTLAELQQPTDASTTTDPTEPSSSVAASTTVAITVAPTVPPTVAPTSPPATAPPTTGPDTAAPVFQSAEDSPFALSSADTTLFGPTCSPTYNSVTATVTAHVVDDGGVVSVTVHYTAASVVGDATLTKVGEVWQGTIGPFRADQVPTGIDHPIDATFTSKDAAGNTRITNVPGIGTVTGCPIIT